MKFPHWLRCRWSKWEPYFAHYTKKAQSLGGVIVPLDKPFEYTQDRERRHCAVCGATQDRLVAE